MRPLTPLLVAFATLLVAIDHDARASSTGMPGPTCAPLDAFSVKTLKDAVKHEYKPSYGGCTLAIDLAACAAPTPPTELVYSTGYGHSFGTSLIITSLRPEGDTWQITRLVLSKGTSTNAKYGGERSDSIRVTRGTLDGAAIESAIGVAEVTHAFTLRELPPPPTSGLGFGGWFSSSDFLASITLVAPGMAVDRAFVGYSSSDSQIASLPLSLAIARLDAAIPATSLAPSSYDAAARALFASEFARRAPQFDDEFHWWVREAFVRAAGEGGDLSVVPVLRRYLGKSDPSSGERTKIAAISALAVLTGVDKRFTTSGVERPVDVVALEYAKLLSSK